MRTSSQTRNSVIIVAMVAAIISCGSPSSDSSSEAPQPEEARSATDLKTVASDPSAIAAPADRSACLTDCNPPKEVVVSFAKPVSLTPQGCTASNVRAFDDGDGFTAFVQANCSGSDSLYARHLSYSGYMTPDHVAFDTICPAGRGGVVSFSIDKGASGYLLSVTCRASQTTFSTYVVATDIAGRVTSSRLLATTSNSSDVAVVAWNEDAGAFGVARSGTFHRFAEDGQPLGGSVAVPASASLLGLSSQHGNWNVLQGASMMSSAPGAYCSKISRVGTLQCDRESLNSNSFSNTIQGIVDGSWILSASHSGEFWVGTFDPLACKRGDLVAFGNVVDRKISQYLDGAILGQNYLAVLYAANGPALNAAFLDIHGMKVVSTSAVMDGTPLRAARLLVVQKRLYVVAAVGNDAVMTWTEQQIEP